MREKMGNPIGKGFLFTALALVVLTFMLASLSASSSAASQAEQTHAYRFKVEALNSLLESTNDAQLSSFAQMSLLHSISALANKSVVEPIVISSQGAAQDNAQTGNVNIAIGELMLNGRTTAGGSFISPLEIGESGYSVLKWEQALNASAAAAGFSLSFGEVSDFKVEQADAWSVNVQFSLPLNISDSDGSFFVQKVLHANATTGIEGIFDPMVAREDPKSRLGEEAGSGVSFAKKQIFRNPDYATPASVAPRNLVNESGMPKIQGLGWFYGPLMEISKDDIGSVNASEARASIYMPDEGYYEGIENDGNVFGAVLIRTPPVVESTTQMEGECEITTTVETRCVNCVREVHNSCSGNTEREVTNKVNFSYIATDGVNVANWYANAQSIQGKKHVLFDNEFGVNQQASKADGYHRIYDIENLRDMAVCGFYVQNENAPSFFQRMLGDAMLLRSPLGIESFLVGQWAGGGIDGDNDGYSRVDRVFYSQSARQFPDAIKIKGMPGCKSLGMCGAQEAIEFGVGHFRLDKAQSMGAYGAGIISCNGTFGGGCG